MNEFWQWLAGGAVSLAGAFFGVVKYFNGQLEKKADKEELNRQRDNIAGIFERLGEVEVSNARIETRADQLAKDMEKIDLKLDRIVERLS